MLTRGKNRKYNHIGQTCKTIAGSLALVTWLLMFFAGAIKANAGTRQLLKTGKTIVGSPSTPANLPADPAEPLPLPEDPETYVAETEDYADDDKKAGSALYFIQLMALQQTTEIQSVQSFHYNQAIQQRIAIPLFILHHSWKSYLI